MDRLRAMQADYGAKNGYGTRKPYVTAKFVEVFKLEVF
jgi:hypothetical protein